MTPTPPQRPEKPLVEAGRPALRPLEILDRSAEDLQRRAEAHRRLLARLAKGSEVRIVSCFRTACSHKRRLRTTLVEAIEVLEGTRQAFKSKRLEMLRKKLVGILAESE